MFVSMPSFAEGFIGLHPFSIEGFDFCHRVIPNAESDPACANMWQDVLSMAIGRSANAGHTKGLVNNAATLALAEQLSRNRRAPNSSTLLQ